MSDQFDERLTGRIRDVFSNFEDDSADEGWNIVKEQLLLEKKKRTIPVMWWRAAAVFTFMAGTWLYLNRPVEKIYLSGKAVTDSTAIRQQENKPQNNEFSEPQGTEVLASEDHATAFPLRIGLPPSRQAKVSRKYHKAPEKKVPVAIQKSDIEAARLEEQRVVSNTPSVMPENEPVKSAEKENKASNLEQFVVADMLNARKKKPVSLGDLAVNEEPRPKKKEKTTVGITAGSFLSYAKGTEGSINAGVGLLSDIPLTKKLKITTGLALAQNNLKYQNSFSNSVTADFKSSVAQDQTSVEIINSMLPGFAPTITSSSYDLRTYNASLLGLDIPVNLKYALSKGKKETYVSAGLSSNLFLQESYYYTYDQTSGSTTKSKAADDKKSESRFKNFDVARMLNLSIGMQQPLNKHTQLSLEPFVKYPLGGQGARDIKFGSVGLNLKLNLAKENKDK